MKKLHSEISKIDSKKMKKEELRVEIRCILEQEPEAWLGIQLFYNGMD